MARISKGILGGFAGTVGTVVGSTWRGIEYIRSRAAKRKSANTQKQLEQQAKFALMLGFLQTMKDLLSLGYKEQAFRMTELNSAMGYNLKNAVAGEDPAFFIAYPEVQISRGSLPNARNPVAQAGEAGTIRFNWTNNSGLGKAKATDQAILVAYCEALQQTEFFINAPRESETGLLSVPAFSGHVVQTWISFVSEKQKEVATSIFTGVVNVV